MTETSSTQASGASYPPGAVGGSCADGFGHSQSMTQTPIYAYPGSTQQVGTSGSASLGGTRYSAQSGSAPSVSCTPTASASASSTASSSLTYTASVTAVAINPVGAVKDSGGNWDILVGQHCTPTLGGVPSGTGWSATYQWSVSGSTFQSWTASSSITAFTSGPGPLNVATPGWYWYDAGKGSKTPETITCSASVTPPAGLGSPFTVSAKLTVNVWVPSWTAVGTAGTMQVNTSIPHGNGSDYWLYAGGPGMAWTASVTSPMPALFGDGTIELVQTYTPNLSYTTSGGGTHNWSLNRQNGLDTYYPYPGSGGTSSFNIGDSPGLNLTATAAVSASLMDQFQDYLMYLPPGSSQYVPLAQSSWSTNGSAALPMMATSWAGYSGSAGSISGGGQFSQNNSFPSWTQNVGNNAGGHF